MVVGFTEKCIFYRDVDSDSDDDYDDIYEGLKFGRKKPLEAVEVRIYVILLLCYKLATVMAI